MIAQLLNRQFVLEQLADVRRQLEKDVEQNRSGGSAGVEHLESSDYEKALGLVAEAEISETQQSSGQPGFESSDVGRSRAHSGAPLDDFSFLSRDPVINIVQSALEEYFEERGMAPAEQVERVELPDDRRGLASEVAVTDCALRDVFPSRIEAGRRIFNKFSITDAGWVSCKVAEGIRLFTGKHSFNEDRPAPLHIADQARVLLVGDWGTGLPRAREVSGKMRRFIEEGKASNLEVHVIHLGDVYYAGWEREYRKRFLPHWPVKPAEADSIGSWCLNANHDMYSGGYGYFDFLLADGRFGRQQRSSYFELFNQHWQIIGLDSGWDAGDLKDPQSQWVETCVASSERKVMLLSHHPLFSVYDPKCVGKEMGKKLRKTLQSKRVRGWFWGHEHRCMLYDDYLDVPFARCVGNGGVPVYMTHNVDDPYPAPGNYEYRGWIDKGLEPWALMGFAVLDFDGPAINIRYVNEYGNTHKAEVIE